MLPLSCCYFLLALGLQQECRILDNIYVFENIIMSTKHSALMLLEFTVQHRNDGRNSQK